MQAQFIQSVAFYKLQEDSPDTAAVKADDKLADIVTKATLEAMKKLPPEKAKTMTFNYSKEFAGFKELEQGLNMRSYFARPYNNWESGTNEKNNGLQLDINSEFELLYLDRVLLEQTSALCFRSYNNNLMHCSLL
jgi:hypothetical protein